LVLRSEWKERRN